SLNPSASRRYPTAVGADRGDPRGHPRGTWRGGNSGCLAPYGNTPPQGAAPHNPNTGRGDVAPRPRDGAANLVDDAPKGCRPGNSVSGHPNGIMRTPSGLPP